MAGVAEQQPVRISLQRRPATTYWPQAVADSQRELLFGRAVPFRPRPPAAACRAQLPLLFLRASIVLGLVQIAMAICYGKQGGGNGDRREDREPRSRKVTVVDVSSSSIAAVRRYNFIVILGVTAYGLCVELTPALIM